MFHVLLLKTYKTFIQIQTRCPNKQDLSESLSQDEIHSGPLKTVVKNEWLYITAASCNLNEHIVIETNINITQIANILQQRISLHSKQT